MDMTQLLVICGGGFVFLLLLFIGLGGDKRIEKRLQRVTSDPEKTAAAKIKTPDRISAIRNQNKKTPLDRLAQYLPNIEKLRGKIARTGRNITTKHYLFMTIGAAIFGFLVMRHGLGLAPLPATFGTILVTVGLPYKIIIRMGNRRINKFIAGFPEAIDTMVRGLRSGLPVSESINAVGREMPNPVGEEFRRMSDAMRLGLSMDEAMWDVAKRIDTPEFRFLIIAMAIQRETGGNLGETLANLSELLRRRRQLKMKIRAMSSEARASAMIIGSLPFIMFCLLYMVSKPYMMTMLTTPQGHTLLAVAAVWMFLGVLVMRKMIDFEI